MSDSHMRFFYVEKKKKKHILTAPFARNSTYWHYSKGDIHLFINISYTNSLNFFLFKIRIKKIYIRYFENFILL